MVLALDLEAELFHGQGHFAADVLLGVGGRNREVTFLEADFVAEVRVLIAAGVPDGFLAVHGVEATVALGVILDVVEDEELSFGSDEALVSQAGADEVFLGAGGDSAGIAVVGFLRARLRDGAGQRERHVPAEGINERRGGVGHRQHVGSFDALPTAHGGTVEAETFGEDFLGEFADGATEVLPHAERVHEFEVNNLGARLLGQFNHTLGSTHFSLSFIVCFVYSRCRSRLHDSTGNGQSRNWLTAIGRRGSPLHRVRPSPDRYFQSLRRHASQSCTSRSGR